MTRRDFQLIADAIRDTREGFGEYPPIGQLITLMGTALYGTNPRFDRGRFERACEARPSTELEEFDRAVRTGHEMAREDRMR